MLFYRVRIYIKRARHLQEAQGKPKGIEGRDVVMLEEKARVALM